MSETVGKISAQQKLNKDLEETPLEPTPEIQAAWNNVHSDMRQEFGEAVFRSWLKPLTLRAYYHGTMEVSVPTRFMRDWIQTHYADRISAMCSEKHAEIRRVQIVVVQSAIMNDITESEVRSAEAKDAHAETLKNSIVEISSPLDERYTFDSFVVGKPNALAHAAARRVVESASVPFNPLFIYGGVGLGKTHLMHAISHALNESFPEKTVMYLSAEKFMYQFVKALRANDTMNFKETFRSVDVLMIDDIQFIAGKESTQEEFTHSMRWLIRTSRSLSLLTVRRVICKALMNVCVLALHGAW